MNAANASKLLDEAERRLDDLRYVLQGLIYWPDVSWTQRSAQVSS